VGISFWWRLKKLNQEKILITKHMSRAKQYVLPCNACWCFPAIELNLIASFKIEPIFNMMINKIINV
jgi:hypothetical protein